METASSPVATRSGSGAARGRAVLGRALHIAGYPEGGVLTDFVQWMDVHIAQSLRLAAAVCLVLDDTTLASASASALGVALGNLGSSLSLSAGLWCCCALVHAACVVVCLGSLCFCRSPCAFEAVAWCAHRTAAGLLPVPLCSGLSLVLVDALCGTLARTCIDPYLVDLCWWCAVWCGGGVSGYVWALHRGRHRHCHFSGLCAGQEAGHA